MVKGNYCADSVEFKQRIGDFLNFFYSDFKQLKNMLILAHSMPYEVVIDETIEAYLGK